MRREWQWADAFSEVGIRGQVIRLLASITRGTWNERTDKDAELQRMVEGELQRQFPNRPELTNLAAELGLSSGQLAARYQRLSGESISAFVRKMKLQESLHMLRNTRMSLAEIALACGYFDQAHFTRIFRQQTGHTPGRYRTELGYNVRPTTPS